MAIKDDHYTGGATEGGITSSYATNDGVKLKVAYSFMGSIYDEAARKAAKGEAGKDAEEPAEDGADGKPAKKEKTAEDAVASALALN